MAAWAQATELGLESGRQAAVKKQTELTARLQQKLEEMRTRLEAAMVATSGRPDIRRMSWSTRLAPSPVPGSEKSSKPECRPPVSRRRRLSVAADQAVAALLVNPPPQRRLPQLGAG